MPKISLITLFAYFPTNQIKFGHCSNTFSSHERVRECVHKPVMSTCLYFITWGWLIVLRDNVCYYCAYDLLYLLGVFIGFKNEQVDIEMKKKKSFLMSSWRYSTSTRSNDKASHHVRIIDEFWVNETFIAFQICTVWAYNNGHTEQVQ